MRGALAGAPIAIRNPDAVRPWQHVLNPLSGYLMLAQRLWDDAALAGGWNFGPDPGDAQPVRQLVDRVDRSAGRDELRWAIDAGPAPARGRDAAARLRRRPTSCSAGRRPGASTRASTRPSPGTRRSPTATTCASCRRAQIASFSAVRA